MNLQQYRPTTLAAMIADTSQYLAEQYDGAEHVAMMSLACGCNVISAQKWDALHAEMMTMIDALDAIVGDERDAMLMEAGADPEVIYEGAPA